MSWANPPGTIWITASVNGNEAGICAMAFMHKNARCKSDVVKPFFRGQGVYRAMSAFRLELAREEGMSMASAFAGPMSIGQFLKDGFVQQGPLSKHDIAYMVKTPI